MTKVVTKGGRKVRITYHASGIPIGEEDLGPAKSKSKKRRKKKAPKKGLCTFNQVQIELALRKHKKPAVKKFRII